MENTEFWMYPENFRKQPVKVSFSEKVFVKDGKYFYNTRASQYTTAYWDLPVYKTRKEVWYLLLEDLLDNLAKAEYQMIHNSYGQDNKVLELNLDRAKYYIHEIELKLRQEKIIFIELLWRRFYDEKISH